jgi:hypothetical protein
VDHRLGLFEAEATPLPNKAPDFVAPALQNREMRNVAIFAL